MLVNWHKAFQQRLPKVIFTDGDEALYAAISSVPYSDSINHLLCVFHLFDRNVKKKLQPVISSVSGASSWPAFSRSLGACREAVNEEDFERLWSELLQNWLPSSRHRSARIYLQNYVWTKRKQWAIAFFPESMTLGASSTQRSESWNSLLKCFADRTSLVGVVQSVGDLVRRQRSVERKAVSAKWRLTPLQNSVAGAISGILESLKSAGLSRYACVELRNELSAAERMAVTVEPDDITDVDESFNVSGQTRYVYGADGEMSSLTLVKVNFNFGIADNVLKKMCVVDCKCLYPKRMGLPCRHSMALCMHIDRLTSQPLISKIRQHGCGSALESLWSKVPLDRWKFYEEDKNLAVNATLKSPTSEVWTEGETEENHIRSITETEVEEEEEIDEWILSSGSTENRRNICFPTKLTGNKQGLAYCLMMGHFRAISEAVTSNEKYLQLGFIVTQFVNLITTDLTEVTQVLCNPLQAEEFLSRCLTRSFSLMREKQKVHKNLETAPTFKKSLSDKKIVAHSLSCKVFGSETGQETIRDAEFINTNSSSPTIANPPKRADTRKVNKSESIMHKTRKVRHKRREASRRAPVAARDASGVKTSTTGRSFKRPKFEQSASPKCESVGIRSTAHNIRQHYTSKHREDPTLHPSLLKSRDVARALKSVTSEQQRLNQMPDKKRKNENLDVTEGEPRKRQKLFKDRKPVKETFDPAPERDQIPSYCTADPTNYHTLTRNVYQTPSDSSLEQGCQVEMFWKQDLSWYRGHIKRITRNRRMNVTSITIKYDDGETEHLTNLLQCRWRSISYSGGYPSLSWELTESLAEFFEQASHEADMASESPDGASVQIGYGIPKCRALDFLTLKDGHWLSDAVIHCFASVMCKITTHKDDLRFGHISSQMIEYTWSSGSDFRSGLRGWGRHLELHDVDKLIWPVHDKRKAHWSLCVADTSTREFTIIDPYDPYNRNRSLPDICSNVLDGLTTMSELYNEKYRDHREWKNVSSRRIASDLNLPQQPAGNSTDCGVLVCMYIWSVMVGTPWPNTRYSRNLTRRLDGLMRLARRNIGARIAAPIECQVEQVVANNSINNNEDG